MKTPAVAHNNNTVADVAPNRHSLPDETMDAETDINPYGTSGQFHTGTSHINPQAQSAQVIDDDAANVDPYAQSCSRTRSIHSLKMAGVEYQ